MDNIQTLEDELELWLVSPINEDVEECSVDRDITQEWSNLFEERLEPEPNFHITHSYQLDDPMVMLTLLSSANAARAGTRAGAHTRAGADVMEPSDDLPVEEQVPDFESGMAEQEFEIDIVSDQANWSDEMLEEFLLQVLLSSDDGN